ncbi:MAG: hypothetical protein N2C14_10260, partial [Planctomycetales bacterium]
MMWLRWWGPWELVEPIFLPMMFFWVGVGPLIATCGAVAAWCWKPLHWTGVLGFLLWMACASAFSHDVFKYAFESA